MKTQIMKKLFLFTIIAILPLFTSCTINGTNQNEESEKIEAEKTAEQLYDYISKKDFLSTEKLFSEKFYAVSSKENLHDILEKTNKVLGNYERRELLDWKTSRTIGTNPKSEYLLIYEVKYQKFKAKETITLLKEDGIIKIIGYHVNSDGFLNPELQN
ncbi:DUF4019 domain-containing protein [Flavobacterium microcysteis]